MPPINIGSWVKCIFEVNGPATIGMTNGYTERIFDKADIIAENANIFALAKLKNSKILFN